MSKVPASDLPESPSSGIPSAQVQAGKSERLGYLGMALFVGSLLFAPQDDAHGATLTVNSLADDTTAADNLVTLREALVVANTGGTTDLGDTGAYPGADEIVFDPAITGTAGTITLTSGPLVITDSVTISGPGADVLALDGDDQTRIFDIQYGIILDPLSRGLATPLDVTLSGLTLQNGNSGGRRARGGGGAIAANGANLTIEDCVITENNSAGSGGGVFFFGFYTGGRLTVRNSTISDNVSYYGAGGGICAVYAGSLTLIDSTLSGNRADGDGGGAAVYRSGPVLLETCLLSGNNAYGEVGGGLSALDHYAPLTVLNSVLTGNGARYLGGGLLVEAGSYSGTTTTSASTRAPIGGPRDISLFGSIITDNTVSNGGYSVGGGVCILHYNQAVDITIDHCSISGNSALIGGGLVVATNADSYYSDSQTRIVNSRVQNNLAYISGGVLFLNEISYHTQALTVEGSTISGNYAYESAGFPGPFFFGGALSIVNFKGGTAIRNSTISDNVSYLGGGIGLTVAGEPATIDNCTLSGNVAKAGGGLFLGAPFPGPQAPAYLRNCTISNNEAYYGGGIAVLYFPLIMTGCIVSGNSAGEAGDDVISSASLPIYTTYSLIENPLYAPLLYGPGTILNQDALLEPLANNGGQTQTHALSISSPALDAGINAAIAPFDQRGTGYPRTVNGQTDMGAYEYNPDAPPPEQLFGFGNDSDGDGFSDDAEDAAGTDPEDPLDSPLGKVLSSETQLNPLSVLKLQVTLNFSKTGADKIKLKGRFELPEDTPVAGAAVVVDVAGNTAGFVLGDNPRGATGVSGGNKIKVTAPKGGVSTFVLSMKGNFQDACAQNADMENETTPKVGEGKIVRVALNFSNVGVFRGDVVVSYKATQGKTGKAK